MRGVQMRTWGHQAEESQNYALGYNEHSILLVVSMDRGLFHYRTELLIFYSWVCFSIAVKTLEGPN